MRDFLAHWTASVNWDAWGAMGTVGALLATIYLATRADRDQRKRSAVFLEAAELYLGSIAAVLGQMIYKIEKGEWSQSAGFSRMSQYLAHPDAIQEMQTFAYKDFPNPDAALIWMGATAAVIDLKGVLEGTAGDTTLNYVIDLCVSLNKNRTGLLNEAKRYIGFGQLHSVRFARVWEASERRVPPSAD